MSAYEDLERLFRVTDFHRNQGQVGKTIIFRYKSDKQRQDIYPYVVPRNPKTVRQQDNRGKFAQAMAAWALLSPEDKAVYEAAAKPLKLFGKNLFVKEYMLA